MKKIFIYYSLSGNGDEVANYLSKKKITIRKVLTDEELPKNNILRILAGGFLAFKEYTPKLCNFDKDICEYDEIIIGSPIWNGRLSCPINTVLKELKLKDKKITFILYSGSGMASKAMKKIKKLYPYAEIINIKEPKKYPESLDNLKHFN